MPLTHPLKVFLCHASADKSTVRKIYRYLKERKIDPWLDVVDLIPGQSWRDEIPKAISNSEAVIIFLSKNSINKEGYIQKEIKFALDKANEMPSGRIFLIPAKLEECNVPDELTNYQWVNLFEEDGYRRLLKSLRLRAQQIGATNISLSENTSLLEGGKVVDTADPRRQIGAKTLFWGTGVIVLSILALIFSNIFSIPPFHELVITPSATETLFTETPTHTNLPTITPTWEIVLTTPPEFKVGSWLEEKFECYVHINGVEIFGGTPPYTITFMQDNQISTKNFPINGRAEFTDPITVRKGKIVYVAISYRENGLATSWNGELFYPYETFNPECSN